MSTKVSVITGAGSGLGRAFALELARRGGSELVLIDCDGARLDQLQCEIGSTAQVTSMVVDISRERDVHDVAARYRGQIDLLINDAATSISAPFVDNRPDDFERVLRVNFFGAVYVTRAFLPFMDRGARICNVSSCFAWFGYPGKTAYASSKAALRAFSESLRHELAPAGIGVTLLYPGGMPTRIVLDGISTSEDSKRKEHEFLQSHGADPQRVAGIALNRLNRNPARILIGKDYRLLDLVNRMAPSTALKATGVAARRTGF